MSSEMHTTLKSGPSVERAAAGKQSPCRLLGLGTVSGGRRAHWRGRCVLPSHKCLTVSKKTLLFPCLRPFSMLSTWKRAVCKPSVSNLCLSYSRNRLLNHAPGPHPMGPESRALGLNSPPARTPSPSPTCLSGDGSESLAWGGPGAVPGAASPRLGSLPQRPSPGNVPVTGPRSPACAHPRRHPSSSPHTHVTH